MAHRLLWIGGTEAKQMKIVQWTLGVVMMVGAAAPAMATNRGAATKAADPTIKAREARIRTDVDRKIGDGGPVTITYRTTGTVRVKGRTIKFGKNDIGFKADAFQGPGGGDIKEEGDAKFKKGATGKTAMKLNVNEEEGP